MRFEQLRTLFRSLRFRLTAWNTAVVLLIVIVTLFGVREALRLTPAPRERPAAARRRHRSHPGRRGLLSRPGRRSTTRWTARLKATWIAACSCSCSTRDGTVALVERQTAAARQTSQLPAAGRHFRVDRSATIASRSARSASKACPPTRCASARRWRWSTAMSPR